ncbi:hypothetical protein GUJ93_ZPchr0004g39018 [Zizania palustris]|uniref:Uncharacterized protein n=1 Tax=Zizania palustris TaxID=103762 RepID=A0A8J5T0U1_ZIZPA|nr:hypothetical protein GUJ93_ZPchr0004g39018 [Zizania palustris]
MSGCRDNFIDINTVICGTFKFSVVSEVMIEGSDIVLFEGKTREHLPLTGGILHPKVGHQNHQPHPDR